jgi:hypothetical protein
MASDAIVVHRMHGRARIRVPSKRGNVAYFNSVKEKLSAHSAVADVEVTPSTGSILLLCNGPTDEPIGWAQSQGLFAIKEDRKVRVTAFHDSVSGQVAALNDRVREVTGDGFDLPGLAFVALVVSGVYQIARGNFTAPAWYTAFWYALGLFGKSSGGSGKES